MGDKQIYQPRDYQKQFEEAMYGGKRRAFLLYHRRAGKDFSCWCFMIHCALWDRPGLYYYCAPTYTQAKRIIWHGIDEGGNRLLHYIPSKYIKGKPNGTELRIELINGSIIQLVGSENFDALRGTNPKGVVFSEYAIQDPRCWTEVISPILLKNGGWAVFNTTPQGHNHAYELWKMAELSEDWYTQKLTIEDTNLIPKELIEKEIAEGKSEELIQQEYYVSFARGIEGAYYGKYIKKLIDEGRFTNVPYEEHALVETYWDLGVSDETVILLSQRVGKEIHIIDMYSNQGEGLQHYVKWLRDRADKMGYIYGDHWAPHDIQVRELGNAAKSRLAVAKELGINFRIVPNLPIQDGIELTRGLFQKFWIDKKNCAMLQRALEHYHKSYNDKLQIYSERPVHDWSSHYADSIRYLSVVYNASENRGKMSEIDAEKLENKYSFRRH